jgi:integrase/recombinase XerD
MKEREHRKDEGITHLSPNEKEQLCEHVPAPQIRNELLIRFLWQTGLREHEVRNVRLQDLDRDERIVNIYSEKVYKDREVGYQPSVDFLMNQWLDSGYRDRFSSASDSEYVFVSRKAEKLTEGRVNDVVKKAAENAGIQDTYDDDAAGNTRHTVTAHALRHSFAVQSLKNGMDVRFLQELMGHADISTTERYLKITGREAIEQQRKYGAGARQD